MKFLIFCVVEVLIAVLITTIYTVTKSSGLYFEMRLINVVVACILGYRMVIK